MDNYLVLKMIHVLSSMVLIGTGAGIAFFMLMASRSGNSQGILMTANNVVMADWIFTAPAVIVQLISGLLLMQLLGYSYTSPWFVSVISLFVLIGCCWMPVVWIQYKLRSLAEGLIVAEGSHYDLLVQQFRTWMRVWMLLGIPAFMSIIMILYLMIFKPIAVI
ncbi:MAG: DUF2269 domain-containing protein [Oleispira sp.]|nr:DUF2269 domain-containing protein [Oleispira sp.]MBL4882722.1 DUF2269 domain-containing protein [Oleispira sp.]